MKTNSLYLSTIDPNAGNLARQEGLGIEIAEFCTAENIDTLYHRTDATIRRETDGIARRLLHGPFNELFPCAIDPLARKLAAHRYGQALALAEEYGAEKIILHGGYSPRLYYPCWYVEQSILFWKNFLEEHPGKYQICLENVMEESPGSLLSIVQGVNDPRLRLCLDVGHANAYSSHSPIEWMDSWGDALSHLHLHNNDGSADTHSALNQGTIPMADIIGRIPEGVTATLELPEIGNAIAWLKEMGMGKGKE